MEIRETYFTIRSSLQRQDNYIGLRILHNSLMQSIPPSDRCCFLEHVIHFYMNEVFKHYSLLGAEHTTTISRIANSFCELSRAPRSCQFDFSNTCEDITMLNLGSIENNFKKLPHSKAVLKAIGELDILLHWLDRLH
ncbi:interleukin-20-like [Hyla sarda]|uniref:interleukin-20-like n=1 Tax=Hyla sarda TaxID=327740 RepID=UPI0024C443DD|nr:interleukin-20-like [Hyla sarda]